MSPIISSSVVVIILGFVLAIGGFVHGIRTGKLVGYAILLVGVGLVFLGAWSIKEKNGLERRPIAVVAQ
jgi:hypothetical protein